LKNPQGDDIKKEIFPFILQAGYTETTNPTFQGWNHMEYIDIVDAHNKIQVTSWPLVLYKIAWFQI